MKAARGSSLDERGGELKEERRGDFEADRVARCTSELVVGYLI